MTKDIEQRIRHFKSNLGERKLEVLDAIFGATNALSEGVKSARFRADHLDWISDLNELEAIHNLIDKSRDQSELYHVKPYALPLLSSGRAQKILEVVDRLLPELAKMYNKRLQEKVFLEELEALQVADKTVLQDALYMMVESNAYFGGRANDFPYAPKSWAVIREPVFSLVSCLGELTRYYDMQPVGLNTMSPFALLQGYSGIEPIELPSILIACDTSREEAECLQFLDEQERAMLLEVDRALKAGLCALSVMGIRALFDMFVHKHVSDVGNFAQSLDVLKQSGHISSRQADVIAPVFDIGSAVMHRGHYPSADDVGTCVKVYAHLIQQERSLSSDVAGMKKRVPPRRPPKPKP